MKVVVSSTGNDLDAPVSPQFGRCPTFIFVDTETMEAEAVPNAATGAAGGAGIQASQFVASRGVEAAISGNMGPNSMQVLAGAGIAVYAVAGGTVRAAVDALKSGTLQAVSGATVPKDSFKPGMGGGRGMGGGGGMGRGGGRGRGR